MPPPPPPPGPGPPRGLRAPTPKAPAKGGGTDRNDLLASIQMGKALKKTTTNDRSAPIVDSKAKNSSNGGGGISGGGGGGGYGGGGGGSGGAMMNGGAPQLGGLFAGGMPKLRSTGRGIGGSSEGRSAPILPPGGRNFGSHLHGQRDNSVEPSQENRVAPPASPKLLNLRPEGYNADMSDQPQNTISHEHTIGTESEETPNADIEPSSKASPAPPPPPATRKPSHLHDRRGPLPEPPNPASKPAPPRPPQDISPSSPRGNNPPLPSKPPALVNKPSVGNKPAPPRPPNTAKPAPPPARPMSNGRPAQRSTSFRERGSRDFSDISSETSLSAEGNPNLLTSAQARTLPVPLNKTNQLSQSQQQLHGSGVAQTVGRQSGIRMLNRSQTRPPSERPRPARPPGPAPPPPIQPPPPPPHRNVPPPPSSKPEPPPVPVGPPPPPPARVTSHSQTPRQTEDFESKFKNKFNLRNEFPLPKQYENCTKTYPSRNGVPFYLHRSYLDLPNCEAEGKMHVADRFMLGCQK